MSRRLFFNIFNLALEGAFIWKMMSSSIPVTEAVSSVTLGCVLWGSQRWSQTPRLGGAGCVLGLLAGLGTVGRKDGHHAPGWSRDGMQQGGYRRCTGTWQHAQALSSRHSQWLN